MEEVQIKLLEAEVNVLKLQPGDTLVVKLKGDELGDVDNMSNLQEALKQRFPNNQIMVFFLPGNSNLDMEVVKKIAQEEKQENSCNTASYCANCNCGKKSAALKNLTNEDDDAN